MWTFIYPSNYLFIVYWLVVALLLNAQDFYHKVPEHFVVQYSDELTMTVNYTFFFLTDFFISCSEMCRVPCFICANEFVMSSTCLLLCSLHKQKRGQRKSSGYVKCMWLVRLVILPRHWTKNRNTIQKSKKTDDKTHGYIFMFKNSKLILSIRILRALDLIWKFRNTFLSPHLHFPNALCCCSNSNFLN